MGFSFKKTQKHPTKYPVLDNGKKKKDMLIITKTGVLLQYFWKNLLILLS